MNVISKGYMFDEGRGNELRKKYTVTHIIIYSFKAACGTYFSLVAAIGIEVVE
jgi:hypothetical protein